MDSEAILSGVGAIFNGIRGPTGRSRGILCGNGHFKWGRGILSKVGAF